MIFHDCMPVLLSTGCLSVRCPLAVCPFAVHWLSILLSTGCLSCCSLAVCPSCCSLAVCPFAVHWLSARSLSTDCLPVRCPLTVRSLSTGCLFCCSLSVCTLSTAWLSILLTNGYLYVRCLLTVCPFAVHWLSVRCALADCPCAV